MTADPHHDRVMGLAEQWIGQPVDRYPDSTRDRVDALLEVVEQLYGWLCQFDPDCMPILSYLGGNNEEMKRWKRALGELVAVPTNAVHPSAVVELRNYLEDCQTSLDSWLRAESEGPVAGPDAHYDQLRAAIKGFGKRVVMERNARRDPGGLF